MLFRSARDTEREALQHSIKDVAADLLGTPPDEVLLVPPHTVLKTSSGKIRRGAVRELFEAGQIGQQPPGVWLQVLRLAAHSWRPRLRSLLRWFSTTGYAAYAHLVFWSLAPPAWLLIALLPGERSRWWVMRTGARLLFRLAGIPLKVTGLESWPADRACVMVANHASYLDGVALVAVLPGPFSFVAKRELGKQLVPRVFLGRIGTLFGGVGGLISLYFLLWWATGHALRVRPILVLGLVLLILAIQFISLGLIAELMVAERRPEAGYRVQDRV